MPEISGYTLSSGPWQYWTTALNATGTVTTASTVPVPGIPGPVIEPTTGGWTITWRNWSTTTGAYYDDTPLQYRLQTTLPRTPEEVEELAERQRLAEERDRQAVERRAEAQTRARALLRMVLSPDERDIYEESGEIYITGSDGVCYHIRPGIVGNIHVLDDEGETVMALCAHPDDRVRMPEADFHVGQVLALKADAPGFRAAANVHWRRGDTFEVGAA